MPLILHANRYPNYLFKYVFKEHMTGQSLLLRYRELELLLQTCYVTYKQVVNISVGGYLKSRVRC